MNDLKYTPTIAELWELMTARLSDANDDLFYMSDRQFFRKEAESLRQQLMERCKSVPDSGGQSSIFAIDGGTLLIENTVDRLRHDNAETLSEFIAACGFWLWELQQRGKEAKGE